MTNKFKSITVNFPKPKLINRGDNTYKGHPTISKNLIPFEVTKGGEYLSINYTGGASSLMWATLKGDAVEFM